MNDPGERSVYGRLMPRATVTSRELGAWTVEVDDVDAVDRARRCWWYPAREPTSRWRPILLGGDLAAC